MINRTARATLPWRSHSLPRLSVVLDASDPPRSYDDEPTCIGDGDEPISALTEAGRMQWAGESRARAAKRMAHRAKACRHSGATDG